jgi:hypothetical protein
VIGVARELLQRQAGEIGYRVFLVVKEETDASPLILKAVMMRQGLLYLAYQFTYTSRRHMTKVAHLEAGHQ